MTVVDDFLAQYQPRTSRVYRCTLDEFERLTGSPVEQGTQAAILRYQVAQEGLADATIGRKLSTLSSLYLYLQDRQIRQDNPMRAVRRARYKVDPAASVKYLNPAEIRAIVGAARDTREAALVAVLLHGLRIGEACGLDVGHVRDGALVGVMGKGRRVRSVPLTIEGQRILTEYIADRLSGPLFLSRTRGRLSVRMAQDVIYRVSERSGKRINAHRLRHTFGTVLINSGAGLAHVQDLLGHRNPSTTRVYAKLSPEALRAAVDGAALMGEAMGAGVYSPTRDDPTPNASYGLRLLQGGRDETTPAERRARP